MEGSKCMSLLMLAEHLHSIWCIVIDLNTAIGTWIHRSWCLEYKINRMNNALSFFKVIPCFSTHLFLHWCTKLTMMSEAGIVNSYCSVCASGSHSQRCTVWRYTDFAEALYEYNFTYAHTWYNISYASFHKTANAEQYCVQVSYTNFLSDWDICVESVDRNLFTSLSKVWLCMCMCQFHET
jgi:hypothetical protein